MRKITTEIIKSFNDYLINEEKAAAMVSYDFGKTWEDEYVLH